MSSVSTSGSGAPKSSFSFGRIWDQYGMLVVFAVLFIACGNFYVGDGGVWHVVLPCFR